MADGDEKIDHNDRVFILNRVSDAPTEAMYNGIVQVWKAGEIRSMQRLEAPHYIRKSLVTEDPTHEDPTIYRLVIVDEAKQPVDPDDSAEPLTLAQCKDLAKYGSLNTRNLPHDRLVGGQMLMDEDGKVPTRREIRGAPKDGPDVPPNL